MAASVEAMLDLWSATSREGKARLRPLFKHASVAASAAAFLDGLLGPERRKTGWMRAGAAGDPGPWRQQAVLGRSVWDAEALRDVVATMWSRRSPRPRRCSSSTRPAS